MKVCECCGQVLPDQFEVIASRAKLSNMQRRMFLSIAAGKGTVVPWGRIISGMYADDIDGGPLNLQNTMHATRCHANARLRKVGYVISTVHGVGCRVDTLKTPAQDAHQ